jgi:hypothetical protein
MLCLKRIMRETENWLSALIWEYVIVLMDNVHAERVSKGELVRGVSF